MPDKRIMFDSSVKAVINLENRDVSDMAYILGLFMKMRASYPVDSTSEDLAEKLLNEFPDEVIKEIKRYHGDDFFYHAHI